ncbi:MAG: tryptophan--tRNA ligase [Christensenellales bacterium]|jgi:tryptophanyl-tRNA synthetase
MIQGKKVILSGIKPSGDLTLGNYIGALRNWANLSPEFMYFYFIADMHAITVRQNPAELRRRSLTVAATYLACGLDPEKYILFIQSQVPEHAELCWILNCFSYMGEMSRMTQFKEKSRRIKEDSITVGLYDYPALMAADILLYQADLVPVGADQKQHLELTRNIAERFNNLYSPTFTVPDGFIPEVGARVMSLQEPTTKMSKSDEPEDNGCIYIMDKPEDIKRKIKRAVTDSDGIIRYDPEKKPGISNLMTIYACTSGASLEETEKTFEGKGYGAFKATVADSVVATLEPIQNEVCRLLNDKSYLNNVLLEGAAKASIIARKTLRKVQKKVGFVLPE